MRYLDQALSTDTDYSSSWKGEGARETSWSELLWPLFWKYMRITLYLGIFYYVSQFFRDGMGMDNMSKFDFKSANDIKQRLDDVKGIDEIREEIINIIKIIKNPDLYSNKGAKLFKGVMLLGPPGTGKTLLARAIAGEAGCNFIFCSGSDFDEMFVGVGAKRVK